MNILLFSALFIPVIYCKYQSVKHNSSRSVIWWLAGFVLLPVLQLGLIQPFSDYADKFNISLQPFLWLWGLEVLMLLKSVIKPLKFDGFKQRMTMDNILLGIIILTSLFWALVFNSIDNPVDNQPINIVIDLKRNLLNFGTFFFYFFQFFIIYFCLYAVYWINHHILVNKVMAKYGLFNYLWVAILFTLIAVPTFSQLVLLLDMNTESFTFLPSGNHDPFDRWNYQTGFLLMLFSLPVILSVKWQKQSTELAVLQQQNTQTELKWLQQQINPHFLFNTLNNLYSLTLSKSEKAPDTILQLANLLRFVVYKGSQKSVPLADELTYLNDYIALQQIRVSHKTQIRFDVDASLQVKSDLEIAPLMFVLLLENAFKHGIDNSDQSSWINVSLKRTNHQLAFRCENSVDDGVKTISEQGIGLENLRRRLALTYPNQHHLKVNAASTMFSVELTINIMSPVSDHA